MIQVVIALDQLVNTLLGGYADETLSARAWRTEHDGKFFGKIFRPIIDIIFFWDENHCYESYISEVAKRQFPREYR
jgi:hypothetical protein